MAFPTITISTQNLDSATADPSLARVDLLSAVVALNLMIEEANGGGGVALLNSAGKIDSGRMPNNFISDGTMSLSPTNGIVSMATVLRMPTITVDIAYSLLGTQPGDVVMVEDGDAGSLCLAVYNGVDWLKVSLGAPISAT
tara:strand:+ start:227 stop:649 length:423 start_codon:yes stop_codon:yes gene_type:complete